MTKNDRPKSIGILNAGKDNTFIDVTTEGFDVGIQDEGSGSRYHRITNILRRSESSVLHWFKTPIGKVTLLVVAAVLAAFITHQLGWT